MQAGVSTRELPNCNAGALRHAAAEDASSRAAKRSAASIVAAIRSRGWVLSILVVASIVSIACFFELGRFKTLGRHEAYVAVVARQMAESGDWVVPRFGGVPRLKKPPLAYWLTAGSAKLFGEFNEWTMRFPSAVAALLLTALVGFWATKWYGRTAGVSAALVQGTSAYVMVFARTAEVDMLLLLLTTAAMYLIVQQPENATGRNSFARWIGIYLLLSLAWMSKFHYGPAMVIAPALVFFAVQRQPRRLLHLANPVGLAVFAASVFVWSWLVLQRCPEAWTIWREQTLGRAVGELGRQPIWFYAPHLLALCLPWTPFALAAVPGSWKRAWTERDARERFLWIWLLTQFAIVTVSANKHKHYILPALPVCSLLAAQSLKRLVALVREDKLVISFRSALAISLISLATATLAATVAIHRWPYLAQSVAIVAVIGCVGSAVVAWLIAFRRLPAAGGFAVVAGLACFLGVTGRILPAQDHRQAAAMFAADLREEFSTQQEICVYRMLKDPVFFYLGEPALRVDNVEELRQQLAGREKLLVVLFAAETHDLEKCGRYRTLRTMTVPAGVAEPHHSPMVLCELIPNENDGRDGYESTPEPPVLTIATEPSNRLR